MTNPYFEKHLPDPDNNGVVPDKALPPGAELDGRGINEYLGTWGHLHKKAILPPTQGPASEYATEGTSGKITSALHNLSVPQEVIYNEGLTLEGLGYDSLKHTSPYWDPQGLRQEYLGEGVGNYGVIKPRITPTERVEYERLLPKFTDWASPKFGAESQPNTPEIGQAGPDELIEPDPYRETN